MKNILFVSSGLILLTLSGCDRDSSTENETLFDEPVATDIADENQIILEPNKSSKVETLDPSAEDDIVELENEEELTWQPSQLPDNYEEFSGISSGAYCNFMVDGKLVYTTDYGVGVFGINDFMFSADYDWFGQSFDQDVKNYNVRIVVTGTSVGTYYANFKSNGESVQTGVEEGKEPFTMTLFFMEKENDPVSQIGKTDGYMICGA